MVVSVIIPTYNRSNLIGLTLASFVKQNFVKQNFEVIVVDNNSTDNTNEVVNKYIEQNLDISIRYIKEKRQGVHYARNTAAKLAKGEFLYFTDDDMIADQNLLSELLYLFSLDKMIASVTGIVLPTWETEPPSWILKLCNNGLLSLNNPDYDLLISENDCNVYSCHQMIKREIFLSSGGFNPENTMGEWIGDGETGLNIKLKEMGFKFAFNRKSIIHHIIPAVRITQRYINKRLSNQGNSDCYTDYRKFNPSVLRLFFNICKYAIQSVFSLLKCIFNLVRFNIFWHLNLSACYYYIAKIKYSVRLIFDRNWRNLVLKRNWIDE